MAAKKTNTSANKYLVTAPVKNYHGKGPAGIQFAYGKAIVYEGHVLNWFKEHGYTVEKYKVSNEVIEPTTEVKE